MSLTNVCEWNGSEWKRVTADDVHKRGIQSTISAKQERFFCNLCLKHVTYVPKGQYQPHFRHNPGDDEKQCEERTEAYKKIINQACRELPIRLVVKDGGIHLELGLYYLGEEQANGRDGQLNINFDDNGYSSKNFEKPLTYSSERINKRGITYVPLGCFPHRKYILSNNLVNSRMWPSEIEGIREEGGLFKVKDGKKVSYYSDVFVGEEYYLLKHNPILKQPRKISFEPIYMANNIKEWNVYKIKAEVADRITLEYFAQIKYRLVKSRAEYFPVWPEHIYSPYSILYKSSPIVFYTSDNVEPVIYPKSKIECSNCSNTGCNVHSVKLSKNASISFVANEVSRLAWYNVAKLTELKAVSVPTVTVKDKKGNIIEQGSQSTLPAGRELNIQSQYDGFILILQDELVISRYQLQAEKQKTVDNLHRGQSVEVYQGLDLIWTVSFEHPVKQTDSCDDEMIGALKQSRGDLITIPRNISGLLSRMDQYPQTKKWLKQCIRKGYIPQRAYNILVKSVQSYWNTSRLLGHD